jgi:hypothetical protein
MRTRFGLLAVVAMVVAFAAVSATAATLPVSTNWSTFNWSSGPGVMAIPSFDLTTGGLTTIQVTDAYITGDQFEVYVDGLLKLTTNSVREMGGSYAASGDDAWPDARYSKGWFDLGAGDYVIEIKNIAGYTSGDGYIRAIQGEAVPEPMSLVLGAMGLAAMGGLRKLRVR